MTKRALAKGSAVLATVTLATLIATPSPAAAAGYDVELGNDSNKVVEYSTNWCDGNVAVYQYEYLSQVPGCSWITGDQRTLGPGGHAGGDNDPQPWDVDSVKLDGHCNTDMTVHQGIFNSYDETRGERPNLPTIWVRYSTEGSAVTSATVHTKSCYPVNGLNSPLIGSNNITVSWTSVPNALHYRVYRNGALWTTTSATSYNFTGLAGNTTYTLGVRWVTPSGIVSDLAQITRTTGTPPPPLPPAVTNCTWSISNGKLYAGHYWYETAETYADAAAAREAQCLLKAWGSYNPGAVDGQWGPSSRAAAQAFQNHMNSAHGAGLSPDGYVGPQTWPHLRSHQDTPH